MLEIEGFTETHMIILEKSNCFDGFLLGFCRDQMKVIFFVDWEGFSKFRTYGRNGRFCRDTDSCIGERN